MSVLKKIERSKPETYITSMIGNPGHFTKLHSVVYDVTVDLWGIIKYKGMRYLCPCPDTVFSIYYLKADEYINSFRPTKTSTCMIAPRFEGINQAIEYLKWWNKEVGKVESESIQHLLNIRMIGGRPLPFPSPRDFETAIRRTIYRRASEMGLLKQLGTTNPYICDCSYGEDIYILINAIEKEILAYTNGTDCVNT